jgi:hypothetical protein
MSDWQPIATAPKDGSDVLLWADTRAATDLAFYLQTGGKHFAGVQIGYWEDAVAHPMQTEQAGWRLPMVGEPTHWMPLPEPPNPTTERPD